MINNEFLKRVYTSIVVSSQNKSGLCYYYYLKNKEKKNKSLLYIYIYIQLNEYFMTINFSFKTNTYSN